MKVAVSIPDKVFTAADELAKTLRKSRSEVYADALAEYLDTHGADAVRKKLDALYSVESSAVDSALERVQFEVLDDEAW
ncbi:MAG: ribbon-helix-helix domain-containing protein [Xanthomonadaceae bacterium]|nr:ribbon-helix-helix domain-containing protein [Xanthomonadaceae bacterium]